MSNLDNIKHEKKYEIRIYNTTDNFDGKIGSGVNNLHVYVQATPTLDDQSSLYIVPNFVNASLLGILYGVDVLPSYATDDKPNPDLLVLRDRKGRPLDHPNFIVPQHGPNNLYPFIFDNYLHGYYYYVWVLAEDKAGNLEILDLTGANIEYQTLTKPLFTTNMLLDTIAPQFNSTEEIDGNIELINGYYYANLPSWVNVGNFLEWLDDRYIIRFEIGNPKVEHYKYIKWDNDEPAFDNGKMKFTFDDGSTLDTTLTNCYIIKETIGIADIGNVTLDIPISDSFNLSGYKIERLKETSPLTEVTDGNATYSYFSGLSVNNEYEDFGLTFDREEFIQNKYQHYFYKITPISKYSSDGTPVKTDFSNALAGYSSFMWSLINEESYFPCSGVRPKQIVLHTSTFDGTGWFDTSANNGTIILKWCKNTGTINDGYQPEFINGHTDNADLDVNDDIEGYEIQRMRRTSINEQQWIEEGWRSVVRANKDSFAVINNFDRSFIDSNLDTYYANLESDPTKSNFLAVNYKYRIRAFDFGGNVGDWAYYNPDNSDVAQPIDITDKIAPNLDNYSLEVYGKIGSWHVEFSEYFDEQTPLNTVEVNVRRKQTNADGNDFQGAGIQMFNKIAVSSYGTAYIEDTYPTDQQPIYARFQVQGRDKNGNWTSWYPTAWTLPVCSKTPLMAVDGWAPKAPTNVNASYDEAGGKVTISWILPTEELIVSPVDIDSINGNTIVVSGVQWDAIYPSLDSLITKRVRILSGTGIGTTGVITTNTTTTITVSSWSSTPPDATSTFEVYGSPLSDLDGCKVFKRKSNESNNWYLVKDTNSNNVTSVNDLSLILGDWIYGVSAYDLSGNESNVTEDADVTTVNDTTPPEDPILQWVQGGVGCITLFWNEVAEDVEYYKVYIKDALNGKSILDINGDFVSDANARSADPIYPAKVYEDDLNFTDHIGSTSFAIYDVTDTETQIKTYYVGIIAIDKFGNSSGDNGITWRKIDNFSGRYTPAIGGEPESLNINNINIDSNDNDGSILFTFSNTNKLIGGILIEYKYKLPNGIGTYNEYGYGNVKLLDDNEVGDGKSFTLHYKDLGNKIYKFRFTPISKFGNIGESNNRIETNDITITDLSGPSLNSDDTFRNKAVAIAQFGYVDLRFTDTLDDNKILYQIYRSPYRYADHSTTNITHWSVNNFYSGFDTQGRKLPSSDWESIINIQSTAKSTNDNFNWQDSNWDTLGRMPNEHTVFDNVYNGYATYAIVARDEFGNPGNPYFFGSSLGNGMDAPNYTNASDNSWIAVNNGSDYDLGVNIKAPLYPYIIYDKFGQLTVDDFELEATINAVVGQTYPNKYVVWTQSNEIDPVKVGLWSTETNRKLMVDTADFNAIDFDTGIIYRIDIYEDSSKSTLLGYHQQKLIKKRESTAFTVDLSPLSVVFQANADGTISSYSNGASVLKVYEGMNQLSYDNTSPYSNGTFRVSTSSSNISVGTISVDVDGKTINIAAPSNMTTNQNNAVITYTITIKGENESVVLTRIQNFSKAKSGNTGAGLVYRGPYAIGTLYYCSANSDGIITRKDVVKGSDNKYYLCKLTFTNSSTLNEKPITGSSYTTYWESFAENFTSVATELLLAENATITRTLTFGSTDVNEPYGIIQSSGVSGQYAGDGFYVRSGKGETPKFRVGTVANDMLSKGFNWDGSDYTIKNSNNIITSKSSEYWNDSYSDMVNSNILVKYTQTNENFESGNLTGWSEGTISGPITAHANKGIVSSPTHYGSYSYLYKMSRTAGTFPLVKVSAGWFGHPLGRLQKTLTLSNSGTIKTYLISIWVRQESNTNNYDYRFGFGNNQFYIPYNVSPTWTELKFTLTTAASTYPIELSWTVCPNGQSKTSGGSDPLVDVGDVAGIYIDDLGVYESVPFIEWSSSGFYMFNSPHRYMRLGSTGLELKGMDLEADSLIVNGMANFGNNELIVGNVVPSTNNLFDLGSCWNRWRKGWISELDSVTYKTNTVVAMGGKSFIAKGVGVLPNQPVGWPTSTFVETLDVNSNIVNFETSMTPGDFVLFSAAGQIEYMLIGTLVSGAGTLYNVTRDLDGTGRNYWQAGTTYVVLGQSGDGRIIFDAENAPKISISTQGATYSAQTEYVRLGNLNGFLGCGNVYGIAIGETEKYLKYDPSNGLVIAGNITATTGKLGGTTNYWNITSGLLTSVGTGSLVMSTSGSTIKIGSATDIDTGAGVFMDGNGNFRVGTATNDTNYIKATTTAVTIKAGTFDLSTNTLKISSTPYISIGSTTPTSATVGTGIWIDATGMYGLNTNAQRFKLLTDGSGWLGASDIFSWTTTGVTTLAGFNAGNADLTKTANGNTTIVSSGTTAFAAGPTGAPIFTVTQAGALTASSATITGNIAATTGKIGGVSGWTIATGKMTSTGIGLATVAGDATYAFWAGDDIPSNAEFSVTHDGVFKSTSGTIGTWIIDSTLLRSGATNAARIELDKGNNRISIFSTTEAKVVMGYLGGLPKSIGTGTWTTSDYGFWARQGETLRIDGAGEHINGDWIIKSDAAYLIQNSSGYTIAKFGSHSGITGVYFYDGTGVYTDATLIARYTATATIIGKVGANQSNINITSGKIELRNNTTPIITLNSDGTGIFSGNITASGKIQTATSGQRVVIEGNNINNIKWYDSSGNEAVKIGENVNGTGSPGIVALNGIFYSLDTINGGSTQITPNGITVTSKTYQQIAIFSGSAPISGSAVGLWGSASAPGSQISIGTVGKAEGIYYNYGVRGYATTTTTVPAGKNHGIYGEASGASENYGASGIAYGTGGTTINYGVYGNASGGATNYAGYFGAGDVYVTNALKVGSNLFEVDSSGQIKKINNTNTSGYIPISNGTHYEPRALTASDMPSSINATKIADGSISNTEFQYLNNLSGNIQTQLSNLISHYGEMVEYNNSTTITCDGSTYVKYSGMASGLCSTEITFSSTNDELSVDASAAGKYLTNYSVTFTVNTAGDYYWALKINGNTQEKSRQKITCATGTSYNIKSSAIFSIADGDLISIGCFGTNTNVVTVLYINVNMIRITN